jgi:hypothetical protein
LFVVKSRWIYRSILKNFEAFLRIEKWTQNDWHSFIYNISCGPN